MVAQQILGIILLIIQFSIIIPLVVELGKTRSSQGISLISEVAWVIAGLGWSIYGFLISNITLIISGALATTGSLIVILLIRKDLNSNVKRKSSLFGIFFFVSMIITIVLYNSPGLSIFLSAFGIIQFVPQVIVSFKSIFRKDAHGVPIVSTSLRALYTFTWAFYAAAWFVWGISFKEINWPLAVWGLSGFIAFSLQAIAGIMSKKAIKRS